MRRNRRKFYYENLTGKTDVTDTSGYKTGEFTLSYGTKNTGFGNISGAKSNAYRTWYGIAEEYDKVLIPEGCTDITEESMLWIDDLTADKPDYMVVKISETVNTFVVYVKKVS